MIFVSLFFAAVAAHYSASMIDISTKVNDCMKASGAPAKKYKNKNAMFSLFYGHAGMEVFNTVHSSEIKQIVSLAKCSQQYDQARFFASSDHTEVKGLTAGSNVTFLTGTFQKTLPHVHEKLLVATNYGFARNRIEADIYNYGVRSVQYLSFEKEGIEQYRDELQARITASKEAQSSFIIHSKESAEAQQRQIEQMVDPDSDDAVMHHLVGNTGTSYYLLLALSDRPSFVGGEILVNKRKQQSNNPGSTENGADNNEEDEDDDEEDEDAQRRDDALVQAEIDKKMIKYNKLSRFTPDKSSIVVVEGGFETGTREIKYGTRNMLLVEFWPYEDAEIGSTRPEVTSDLALKRRNSMLGDL